MDIRLKKWTSAVLILANSFFPLSPALAVTSLATPDAATFASGATLAGSHLNAQDPGRAAAQTATGIASGEATREIDAWLKGKGKAALQFSTEHGTLKNSELGLLYPVYESNGLMAFTQGNLHRTDARQQSNLGMGLRYSQSGWMLGTNAFYDRDYRLRHHRFGVGVEYARDDMRLAANGYQRLSSWRDDKRHYNEQSRPAQGWDIRAEAWLPAWPQLGGKLNVERYYGDAVALISDDHRQKNPWAITTGVNYTPIPLITAGVDVKSGKSHSSETQFGLNLNYVFGEFWSKQISADAVAAQRSLVGSRYDFVNRNNNIVLDYRQKATLTLGFPGEIRGTELAEVAFIPAISPAQGAASLTLNDAALIAGGGEVLAVTPERVLLKLPAWRDVPVPLSGVAIDARGNRSNLAETVIITRQAAHLLSLTSDKTEALADGHDAIALTLHVTTAAGTPLVNSEVTLESDGGTLSATHGKTDAHGDYRVTLTSDKAGEIHVTAIDGAQHITHPGVFFRAESHETLTGTLTTNKTRATASGADAIQLALTLTDGGGRTVAGETVNWSTTLGDLSGTSSQSDKNGVARISLTSRQSGEATVTASAQTFSWSSETLTFAEEALTLNLEVDKTSLTTSPGEAATFTLHAAHADGTPAAGETVAWTTDFGTLSGTSSQTDSAGQATVTLSSSAEGVAQVSATVGAQPVRAPQVTFTQSTLLALAGTASARADGSDPLTFTATVTDEAGNPLAGRNVNWTASLGDLSASQTVTDASGQSVVTLTSRVAGETTVNIEVNGMTISASSTFEDYAKTLTLSADNLSAVAGRDTVTLTASLINQNNQPAAGKTLLWSTTLGKLSAAQSQTDANGLSTVQLTSTTGGKAVVSVSDENQTLTSPPVTVSFRVQTVALPVSASAVDKDGTNVNNIVFGTKSPAYAWPGAKLRLTATGATGSVTWKSDASALGISGNVVTINSQPAGSAIISGTDEAGNTAQYTLKIAYWIPFIATSQAVYGSANYSNSAVEICQRYSAAVMSKKSMTSLYNEWGNFMVYSGWSRGYYQTSTAYSGSTDPAIANWAFWPETNLWLKNSWTMLLYACL